MSAVEVQSPSGLRVELNRNGSIRRIDHGGILVNLFLGSEMEGGPANLHLRLHGDPIESTPLLGPSSPAMIRCDGNGLVAQGEWRGIRFRVTLVLARSAPAWFWHVALENAGTDARTVDLVYAQDLALADYGAVRMNEYYVSQYVDHTPLAHPERGTVLAVRQNLPMGGRHPWLLLGALGRGASFATDALDLHGLATRAGEPPVGLARGLPGRRRQHEHSMAVIQDASVQLAPRARTARGFFAWLEPDHREPTSPADLASVDRALALPEARPPAAADDGAPGERPAGTLFTRPPLATREPSDGELARIFGDDWRHVEREGGTTLSFFTGANTHVVTSAKERRVLRPHGAILRTGDALAPDEASLTSTAWMGGVFHSMVTQGHVSINRFLSTTRSYLGLTRSTGQRIFLETADGWMRLDVPSAFAMTPASCRWIYVHRDGVIGVESRAATDRHELRLSIAVLEGPPCRFLVSHHVALGGDDGADPVPVHALRDGDAVVVRTVPDTDVGRRFPDGSFRIAPAPGTAIERVGGDELLFGDGGSRAQPFLVLVLAPTRSAELRLTGALVPTAPSAAGAAATPDAFWRAMAGAVTLSPPAAGARPDDVGRIADMLPWLAQNALVHYLAPRGLEQYSGGGWGTRDVSQGPVELLVALGRWDALRDLLVRLFRAHNADGDWPQWFTFFERDRGIRAGDSHGDIVFWPLVALAQYLERTEDGGFLDTVVPFFHPDGDDRAERAPILDHVERALEAVAKRIIPGTHLVGYGNGDWNDSLQPVDPAMRERLCSTWTVTLHVQALATLAAALRRVGRGADAARLEALARPVREDFQRLLLPDGTLAGFAEFRDGAHPDYWVHPRDRTDDMQYSLLPMSNAILTDLLTPEQARAHVTLIREQLLGVDGARLFDRPTEYRGGRMRRFQRAETSTYFGREIGLMYTHSHLRHAEAMAHWGDVDAFFAALRQAIPIAIHDVVAGAKRRQANCYYSSSDAVFLDRYEAQERYDDVRAGRVAFEGGWRVYSSGAGIAVRLIHECFLGLRRGRTTLTIDPAVPPALDGLRAEIELAGRRVAVVYRSGTHGVGPTAVTLNGSALSFTRLDNPYRLGGVAVPMAAIAERLAGEGNELVVTLG